jgi:hypothetical protein
VSESEENEKETPSLTGNYGQTHFFSREKDSDFLLPTSYLTEEQRMKRIDLDEKKKLSIRDLTQFPSLYSTFAPVYKKNLRLPQKLKIP